MDAVAAHPKLVHRRRADDPGFIQTEQLTPAVSLIAFVGETVPVRQGRLVPRVLLDRVIDIEPLLLRENLAEVYRALLNIHRRSGSESVLVGAGVRGRNQRQQTLDNGVAQ